jgi:hypothetical protein
LAGYFTFSKNLLVNKLLSEREMEVEIAEFPFINVFSNYAFTANQRKEISNLFEKKSISYIQIKDIDSLLVDRLFSVDTLNYTFHIEENIFPTVIVTQSETSRGFASDEAILYAWILFLWVEVKY